LNSDGWWTCFSCDTRWKEDNEEVRVTDSPAKEKDLSSTSLALLAKAEPKGIPERGIAASTVKKFGVAVLGPDKRLYPYYGEDDSVEPIAAQKRLPGKVFPSEGPIGTCRLFGEVAFPKGGKYLVITEGQDDAMAASEMMGGKPAISVRNASTALSDCKRRWEYINSFDTVVLAFDNDEPGKKATKKVANLFGGKVKVMNLGNYKDACEFSTVGDSKAWMEAFWRAETYTPDGIVAGADLWTAVSTPMEKAAVMYPWDGLNELLYGIRYSEMIAVASGSGMGKSNLLREIMWHVHNNTNENQAALFMEENPRKTGLSLMSMAANKQLHLPTTTYTDVEFKSAFEATLGSGRLFFFDHFGSTGIENILARLRYMNKALGCRIAYVDHVSIMVSAGEQGDERKAIDEIMTKLRTLVQELDMALFIVSHLKRPDGKGHEEGAQTSLAHLRGSASIAQLSDAVIGLERDGQSDDPILSNLTTVRVLKNRFSGEIGKACQLLYDRETGRLTEYDYIEAEEEAL
jgi:twinkle protein